LSGGAVSICFPNEQDVLGEGEKFFRKKNEISHPFGKHMDTYNTPPQKRSVTT